MCTVTFVKTKKGKVILTSNRDEKTHRPTIPPTSYTVGDQTVTFPKDELAGGTWIAMGDNGIFCCLLNGAFQLHQSKGNYRRSRGQIVLDVFRSTSPESFLEQIDLENIEPFTLIIYNSILDKLNVLVWDEHKKHIYDLDVNQPHFWASATLYSSEFTKQRRERFYSFMLGKEDVYEASIYRLHSTTKEEGGYILNDRGQIETVSVTQLILTELKGKLIYNDLLSEKQTTVEKTWNKVLL